MPLTYADLDREADERTTLLQCLQWQRDTFELKCSGMTSEQMRMRSCPPSRLSLMGIARHLTGVERWWARINLDRQDLPHPYDLSADENADFEDIDAADAVGTLATWREECRLADETFARHELEDRGMHRDSRRVMTMRWTLVHLVEEYSRHNGHADLLREAIDGATGY